ncbi:MAG: ATP-binding protein [Candidatus Sumerlaeota bacterium]|nr:ATP-binding protein [Candidatus Sumerlaeota bacterium]
MRKEFLSQIQINQLRGINRLDVPFPYPVCVLAGANGCGKSTVLLSLACAYHGPTVGETLSPARLFPNFSPKSDVHLADQPKSAEIVYSFNINGGQASMAWKFSKSKWNKSYLGRRQGSQPVLKTYLHTLSKMTSPSEVGVILQMARRHFQSAEVDASNIAFAQGVLGFRYAHLSLVQGGTRDLLVAERASESTDSGPRYSEFHMSAGERAVLRLSVNLSKLENALVLIDEVEAGLHPLIQQTLMLELQRLSLRNNLQIICATHSPAVLDTVPPEARIFLERVSDNVVRREAYRDIIQKALYGRSQNNLSFLCEDEESENFIRGLLDYLGPKIDLQQNDIEVGRDTGKNQYSAHFDTFARFRKLADVVFVLDGDGRAVMDQLKRRASKLDPPQPARVLCLPGAEPPEIWAWNLLHQQPERYADFFGLTAPALSTELRILDSVFSNAADKPANIAKHKLDTHCRKYSRLTPELFRLMARTEAEQHTSEVFELADQLDSIVRIWRSASI